MNSEFEEGYVLQDYRDQVADVGLDSITSDLLTDALPLTLKESFEDVVTSRYETPPRKGPLMTLARRAYQVTPQMKETFLVKFGHEQLTADSHAVPIAAILNDDSPKGVPPRVRRNLRLRYDVQTAWTVRDAKITTQTYFLPGDRNPSNADSWWALDVEFDLDGQITDIKDSRYIQWEEGPLTRQAEYFDQIDVGWQSVLQEWGPESDMVIRMQSDLEGGEVVIKRPDFQQARLAGVGEEGWRYVNELDGSQRLEVILSGSELPERNPYLRQLQTKLGLVDEEVTAADRLADALEHIRMTLWGERETKEQIQYRWEDAL